MISLRVRIYIDSSEQSKNTSKLVSKYSNVPVFVTPGVLQKPAPVKQIPRDPDPDHPIIRRAIRQKGNQFFVETEGGVHGWLPAKATPDIVKSEFYSNRVTRSMTRKRT